MNPGNKALAAVLALLVLLQYWTLQRQGDLMNLLQSVQANQRTLDSRLEMEVGNLQGRLNEIAEAERWLTVQREEVTPTPSCWAASTRVEWELRQWTAGTTSRLLYRTAPGQPWQEAQVQSLGGQNYTATFQVPVRPMLEMGVSVEYERGATGRSGASRISTEQAKPDGDYQYQILAEGPGISQSSGVKIIPLYGSFMIPVKIVGMVRNDNRYELHLSSAPDRQNCARITEAEVRAYAGSRLLETRPLAQQGDGERHAAWQSPERLTRLEVVIRHSGGEEVVPIDL